MARPFTRLSDSFKIFRDNLNTVSYNVGDPDNLLTYGDSDVVMAINEIERVFDASAGEIIYPTGNALQGETQTRLLISTNQNSGTDVQFNVGANFNVDAVGDINLDAGGANINFLDDSFNRIAFTLGATNTVGVTGVLDLDVSSNLDVDVTGNSTITSTGTTTIETTTFTVDASGDVILDADGGNVTFKDGGVTDYNFATDGTISRTGDLTIDVSGDIIFDADDGNITYKDGGVTRIDYAIGATNTATVTGNLTYDVSGDIVLDAGTNNIDLKGAGNTRFAYGLGTSNTLDVTGNLTQTISGNFSDSASGTYHIGATGALDTLSYGQTHIVRGNYLADVEGNVTFQLNDVFKLQLNGGDHQTYTLGGTGLTLASTGNYLHTVSGTTGYTLDVAQDIVLDAAGNNITFKNDGNSRFEYGLGTSNTLDVTGNLTQTVSGNYSDSAAGTYHIGATGNTDISTSGTFNTKSGAQLHAVTGTYKVDASDDITLDTHGADIYFQDGGQTKFTYNLGADQEIDVAGSLTYDVETDIVLDAGGGDIDLKDGTTVRFAYGMGAANTLDVTGSLAQTVSSNYTMDVTGDHTDSASGIRTINAADGFTVYTNSALSMTADGNATIAAGGNVLLDAEGDITLDANGADVVFKDAGATKLQFNLDSNQTIEATNSLILDADQDITLEANGKDINFNDGTQNNLVFNLGANQEVDVTGSLTYDVEGDINLDAGGHNWNLVDSGETKFGFQSGVSTNTLSVPDSLVIDVNTDITLDANGGNVFLSDDGVQFGRLTNGGSQLDIYSGSTLALEMSAGTIELHNRALFLDSALDTVASNVAGSINEIHTELDSASGEIESVKNTIEGMLGVFDSGGTSANISSTGISTLNTLDKTFVGGINELDARLDSAVAEINVSKGNIKTNDTEIAELDARVGKLYHLDSATTRSFFDSDGTNGSIIKALNELARRAVAIYDENGTLLN